MNRVWKILAIMMALTAPNAPSIAGGQNNNENHHRTGTGTSTVTEITEQKAITIAQQHFKGRVLAVNQNGHIYRIKILSHLGTVHTALIDARDGSVISTH